MAKSNRVLRSSSATANHDDRDVLPLAPSYDRARSPHSNSSKLSTSPSLSLTAKPLSIERIQPSAETPASAPPLSDSPPNFQPRTRFLPPRGYLRNYQLKKIQSRSASAPADRAESLVQQPELSISRGDLLLPFRIAKEGGLVYACYIVTAILVLFFAVTLFERIVLAVMYSSVLWQLPVAIAPFFRIITSLAIRTLVMPIGFGILAVPVRMLSITGSLDLTSLIEATPIAVKRCCSTSWLVALKLLRRLIVVMLIIEAGELLAETEPAFSGLSLLTITGAAAYFISKSTFLCAPILSIVGNYGRRYAMQQASVILQPAAQSIRVCVLCLFAGWFSSHLFVRSLLPFLGYTSASTAFWINAIVWSWYGITYLSSVVLNHCATYEQEVSGAGGSF